MQRTKKPTRPREKPFVAFDFETTPIPRTVDDPMRVDLRYLTAYADDYRKNQPMNVSKEVRTHEELSRILVSTFLVPDRNGTRYIAWNANRFDYRPIVEAIVSYCPQFTIHPYEAGNGPRGFRIVDRANPKLSWEICDGIAMTGCAGWKLRKFLETFAPDLPKGDLDLETTRFDPSNREHVAYAERDSEGLYRAMVRVDGILRDLTGRGLQVTIGNLGIKFFQQMLPDGVQVWNPPKRCMDALRMYGTRGGFCYTSRPYIGPLWTYDRNQEYASIMRTTPLPCGRCYTTDDEEIGKCGLYYVTIAKRGGALIPFYCAAIFPDGSSTRTAVDGSTPVRTCILSNEIAALRSKGWTVTIENGWYWEGAFTLQAMVDELEALRGSCEGGPAGPIGTMVKMLGNHSFGKTLEQPKNERIVICADNPTTDETKYGPWFPGYVAGAADDPHYDCYWFTIDDETAKVYHRPQIGAFITAGARMDMFDLASLAPEAFVKADTDSVAFTMPMAALEAQLHPSRYGALKLESDGDEHIVLGKKGYYNVATGKATCKGLHVGKLTEEHFRRWFEGEVPTQTQTQTLSWKRGVSIDGPQYRIQQRRGTDFARLR